MFSANVLFYKSTIRDIYEASGRKKEQKKKDGDGVVDTVWVVTPVFFSGLPFSLYFFSG